MAGRSYDALLVVSFGGPEQTEDVMPFLENVLRGKASEQQDPLDAMAAELEQQYVEKRDTADREQRFGRRRRQRAESAPEAAAQDHRLADHPNSAPPPAGRSPAGKQALLDEAAYDVPRGYVDLLNQRRRIRRRMQANVAARRHLSPGPAGEADSYNLLLPRGVDRPQDIRGTARCGDREKHIPGASETDLKAVKALAGSTT